MAGWLYFVGRAGASGRDRLVGRASRSPGTDLDEQAPAAARHEDGRYEWVSPTDYRVAEVRLLDDVTTVGDVSAIRAKDNLLIRGDALNALRSLARLPEFDPAGGHAADHGGR